MPTPVSEVKRPEPSSCPTGTGTGVASGVGEGALR